MIIIRDAKAEDSDEIFNWRNDPISRSMFLNTDVVARNDHDQWYAQSLHNPNRKMFIGIYEQSKIGIVRFDLSSRVNEAEVSINLNPGMRGKGLSFPLLRGAINQFLERYPKVTLTAIIKTTNTTSARIFERNDFQLNSHHSDYNHYICHRIR